MAHKDSESTHIAEQFRNDKLLLLLFSFLKVVKCCTYIKKKKNIFFNNFNNDTQIHMEMGKMVCFDRNWQESIKTIEFWNE